MRRFWVAGVVFLATACNTNSSSGSSAPAKTAVTAQTPAEVPPDANTMTSTTGGTGANASPMMTPQTATAPGPGNILGLTLPKLDKSNPNWKFGTPAPNPMPATFDAKKDYFATIHTTLGDITVKFYPDVAPKHVTGFIYLSELGFYNDAPFHRIIPGFMMQGGDPSGQGNAGPHYSIPAEFNARKHLKGTLAMARTNDPNSAGSQFYICFKPTPFLDGQYTVFGEVTKGLDV